MLKKQNAEEIPLNISQQGSLEKKSANMTMVKVYLMDGSYKAIKLDPNSTTVEELWEIASEKLMLTPASCQMFFLWGVAGNLELLLFTHQTISQVFHDWAVFEQRYNFKIVQPMSPKALSTTVKKTLTKSMSSRTASPMDSPKQESQSTDEIRLVFRTTSIVPLKEEKKV